VGGLASGLLGHDAKERRKDEGGSFMHQLENAFLLRFEAGEPDPLGSTKTGSFLLPPGTVMSAAPWRLAGGRRPRKLPIEPLNT